MDHNNLVRELEFLREILNILDPDSPLWMVVAQRRRRTLQLYLNLSPTIRYVFEFDPDSVICIF